jgi:hypothetical protein
MKCNSSTYGLRLSRSFVFLTTLVIYLLRLLFLTFCPWKLLHVSAQVVCRYHVVTQKEDGGISHYDMTSRWTCRGFCLSSHSLATRPHTAPSPPAPIQLQDWKCLDLHTTSVSLLCLQWRVTGWPLPLSPHKHISWCYQDTGLTNIVHMPVYKLQPGPSEIWGSYGGEYEYYDLLVCDAV